MFSHEARRRDGRWWPPPRFIAAVVFVVPKGRRPSDFAGDDDLNQNLGEFEVDVFARKLLVNGAKGVGFVFHLGLLSLVEEDLHDSTSVEFDSDSLTNDFRRKDQIVENGRVDGRQRAVARSLLLLLVTGFLRGFGQDAPLSDEDDVASAELLLQLPDESGLNLLVGFELGNGDEDDDGFLAAADVHLLRGRHVQLAQLRLKVAVHFQLEKSLRDRLLKLVRLFPGRFHDLGRRGIHLRFFFLTNFFKFFFKQIETTQL